MPSGQNGDRLVGAHSLNGGEPGASCELGRDRDRTTSIGTLMSELRSRKGSFGGACPFVIAKASAAANRNNAATIVARKIRPIMRGQHMLRRTVPTAKNG